MYTFLGAVIAGLNHALHKQALDWNSESVRCLVKPEGADLLSIFLCCNLFYFYHLTFKAYPVSGLSNYRHGELLCKPVFPVLCRFKSNRRGNNSRTQ